MHRSDTDAAAEAGAGRLRMGICYITGPQSHVGLSGRLALDAAAALTSYIAPHGDTALMLRSAHAQVHLFDIDIPGGVTFKESKTLTAGQVGTVVDTDAGRLGIGICYDIRFPELSMMYAQRGAQLLVYPGALSLQHGWEATPPAVIGALTATPMAEPALNRAAGGDGDFLVATGQPEASSIRLHATCNNSKEPIHWGWSILSSVA